MRHKEAAVRSTDADSRMTAAQAPVRRPDFTDFPENGSEGKASPGNAK
jgi:hypothetical protein